MTWSTDDIPDLSGKRAVITGVTGGLGLHTAIGLARSGADLVVTARDEAKAERAVAQISAESPGARIEVVSLDLADLSDVTVVGTTAEPDLEETFLSFYYHSEGAGDAAHAGA